VRVVSDTSPICYLLLVGHVEILAALFGRVVVPRAVREELAHPGAASEVRHWIANPPGWLSIQEAPLVPAPDLTRLHLGEREAILLATSLSADLLLLDERRARQAAGQRGLAVMGLLGVLDLAAKRGLLVLPQAAESLRRTSFRIDPRLLRLLLDRRLRE